MPGKSNKGETMLSKNTKSGDKVYHNNTPVTFSCFMPNGLAVVIAVIEPVIDEFEFGRCQGCTIGDADNKIQCTCEEYESIHDSILHGVHSTKIPIVVPSSHLHEQPLAVVKAEEYVDKVESKINDVKKRLRDANQDLRDVIGLHAVISSRVSSAEQKLEVLDNIDKE